MCSWEGDSESAFNNMHTLAYACTCMRSWEGESESARNRRRSALTSTRSDAMAQDAVGSSLPWTSESSVEVKRRLSVLRAMIVTDPTRLEHGVSSLDAHPKV